MIIDEVDSSLEGHLKDSLTLTHQEYADFDYKGKCIDFSYDYNIEDCVLVRTTNHFPFGGIIQTPENANAIMSDYPYGMSYSIEKIISNLPIEERKELEGRLKVNQRVRRKTLHFCINGLVGSHMYGDFSSRPFIIIEPLKYHIEDPRLLSLRPEDTFFKGDIQLSNEAVIIIRSEVYEMIKDSEKYKSELSKYKIVLYHGDDEVIAVNKTLNNLGYDAFVISGHGYSNLPYAEASICKMNSFIYEYAKSHNISSDPHFYSDERYESIEQSSEESELISKNIIQIMTSQLNKSEEEREKLIKIVEKDIYLTEEDIENFSEFINEYGPYNFANLIAQINEQFNQEIVSGEGVKKL